MADEVTLVEETTTAMTKLTRDKFIPFLDVAKDKTFALFSITKYLREKTYSSSLSPSSSSPISSSGTSKRPNSELFATKERAFSSSS